MSIDLLDLSDLNGTGHEDAFECPTCGDHGIVLLSPRLPVQNDGIVTRWRPDGTPILTTVWDDHPQARRYISPDEYRAVVEGMERIRRTKGPGLLIRALGCGSHAFDRAERTDEPERPDPTRPHGAYVCPECGTPDIAFLVYGESAGVYRWRDKGYNWEFKGRPSIIATSSDGRRRFVCGPKDLRRLKARIRKGEPPFRWAHGHTFDRPVEADA